MDLNVEQLLEQHTRLTAELAKQLRELGDLRTQVIAVEYTRWEATVGMPITERREHIRHASANIRAAIDKHLGEVDALRAEVDNVTLRITHAQF